MSTRAYTMTARAAAADVTRDRIFDATIAIALETKRLDFSLDQVAARAGRSVQTILRRFGSRDGLVEAAIARASERVAAERRPAQPGDIPGALELQPAIGRAVQKIGVGMSLPKSASPACIRAAVRRLLDDRAVGDSAVRIGVESRPRPHTHPHPAIPTRPATPSRYKTSTTSESTPIPAPGVWGGRAGRRRTRA